VSGNRNRTAGVAVTGPDAFPWPDGIDAETQVRVVQMMLIAQELAAIGHGDLAASATTHALRCGGYHDKGRRH
jgi:hypothetical protein